MSTWPVQPASTHHPDGPDTPDAIADPAASSDPTHFQPLPAAPPKAPVPIQRTWGMLFVAAAATLLVALLFTPGMPLQWKMYSVVHGICAQQHNIFLAGMQFPICARNTGIYSSFLITLVSLLLLGRMRAGGMPHWSLAGVLGLFVVLMGIDGFNSLFYDLSLPTLYTPRNDLRTLTGMGMGVSLGVVVLLIFSLSLRGDVDERQPVLRSWWELGGILLLNLLVLVAIYGNLDIFYWPLAFLAFFGITSVLYSVNVVLCALFMGYAARVTHLAQLARPATVAFVPTLLMLGAMAAFRFWLESQGLVL